jgi:hypothetical protein
VEGKEWGKECSGGCIVIAEDHTLAAVYLLAVDMDHPEALEECFLQKSSSALSGMA